MSNLEIILIAFWIVAALITVSVGRDALQYGLKTAWKHYAIQNDWGLLTYVMFFTGIIFTVCYFAGLLPA